MPQNFLSCDRDQALLLSPDLRDWQDEDHLAWLVIEAIEELDLEHFYVAYRADGHGATARRGAAGRRHLRIGWRGRPKLATQASP